jgi:hypothetical protein
MIHADSGFCVSLLLPWTVCGSLITENRCLSPIKVRLYFRMHARNIVFASRAFHERNVIGNDRNHTWRSKLRCSLLDLDPSHSCVERFDTFFVFVKFCNFIGSSFSTFLVVEAGLRAAHRVLAFRSMDGKFEGRLECHWGLPVFRRQPVHQALRSARAMAERSPREFFSWHRGRLIFVRKQSRRG